jgi:hypothetical protein
METFTLSPTNTEIMFDINAKVVCIDDRFPAGINDIFNALPRKGSIYTVRDIVPAQDWKLRGTCAVLLRELENRPNQHGIEPGFQCGRFREPTAVELENVATESEFLVNASVEAHP